MYYCVLHNERLRCGPITLANFRGIWLATLLLLVTVAHIARADASAPGDRTHQFVLANAVSIQILRVFTFQSPNPEVMATLSSNSSPEMFHSILTGCTQNAIPLAMPVNHAIRFFLKDGTEETYALFPFYIEFTDGRCQLPEDVVSWLAQLDKAKPPIIDSGFAATSPTMEQVLANAVNIRFYKSCSTFERDTPLIARLSNKRNKDVFNMIVRSAKPVSAA